MTRPISMDLRERAMSRLAAGQSVRQVAVTLGVAPSSVVKWSQRLRATGSCAPAKVGGRRPRKIVGEHEAWLLERIEAPFTLRGLVSELAARGLPPYSPDLNPIEQVFAKLKHLLRDAAERTAEATWERIGTLLDRFSPAECANYIQNAGYASV